MIHDGGESSKRLRESIEAARLAGRGVTAIAREAGVDTTRIYRILEGRIGMSARTACKLAAPLGVTASYLLGLDEPSDMTMPRIDLSESQRHWLSWWQGLPVDVRDELYSLGEMLREVPATTRRSHLRYRPLAGSGARDPVPSPTLFDD